MDSLTRKRIFTNLKNGESFRFLLMTKGLDGLPDLLPFIPPKKNGWDHKHQQTLVVQGLEMFLFFFLVVWIPKNPRVEALLATHYGIIYLLAVFGCISCQTATRKKFVKVAWHVFVFRTVPKEYGNGFLENGHFNKGQDSIQWEIPEIRNQDFTRWNVSVFFLGLKFGDWFRGSLG